MVVSLAGVVSVVVVVEVVVDDDVESLPLSLPPHAAVSVVSAITAAMPAVTDKRRGLRVSVMVSLTSLCRAYSVMRSTHSQPLSSTVGASKVRSMNPSAPRLGLVTAILATACGLAVANLYFAQPILDLLATSFHVSQGAATTAVTVIQVGYAVGLVLLLPMGDLIENRRLTSGMLIVTAAALVAAGSAHSLSVFLAASVVIGITSVVAQILIPFAAHLAPDESRGRIVGWVGSGLLLGILLARTLSSLAAAAWGWRAIFFISAGLMLVMSAILACLLPARKPDHSGGYATLMVSVLELVRTQPVLRRRAVCQALIFAAFSGYWTAIAYQLIAGHGFGQAQLALFALVGAVGVVAAPVSGRIADRGDRYASGVALLMAVAAMIVARFSGHSVLLLGLAAVLLDIAMTAHQTLSQREIYQLRPDARARINTVYMGTVFAGGAVGSALAGIFHDRYGWAGITTAGIVLSALSFALWAFGRLSGWRPEPVR
jgi:predicted MFS family arabinose efflux permease